MEFRTLIGNGGNDTLDTDDVQNTPEHGGRCDVGFTSVIADTVNLVAGRERITRRRPLGYPVP